MTASAPSSPRPGRAAWAGRPAGALLVLLLAALLTALPCAGQAKAVGAGAHSAPAAAAAPALAPTMTAAITVTTAPAAHPDPAAKASGLTAPNRAEPNGAAPNLTASDLRLLAEDQRHWTWCTADGEPPHRDNGCSSHPYCAQDAQLPNPPPHPQPAGSPLTPAPDALPRVVPAGLLDGPHPAPDLHELQVHRS
ncbi:hypothetical protein [Kitasatospora sp. NPDC097643]|uniref:hypothetical protein n=1 Tax=Kitasatospora sp. NPDC097643 TaxID=3157230 RepID=UPI003329E23E